MGGAPATVHVRGVDVDPDTGAMLRSILEQLDAEGIRLEGIPGYGSYRDNDASGATDNGGGHADLYLTGYSDAQCRRAETVARSRGASAFWRPERRPDGTRYGWARHLHVLRMDAPDLSPNARRQVGDYLAGYNGLPVGGRTNRDTGSRAYLGARWLQLKRDDDMELTDTVRLTKASDVAYSSPTSTVEGVLASTNYYVLQTRNRLSSQVAAQAGQIAGLLALVRGLVPEVDVDEVALAKALAPQVASLVAPVLVGAVQAVLEDKGSPTASTLDSQAFAADLLEEISRRLAAAPA